MDKHERKRILREIKERERRAVRDALPVSDEQCRRLFVMLREDLPVQGCDKSRRLTESWLRARKLPVAAMLAFLDEHSGPVTAKC